MVLDTRKIYIDAVIVGKRKAITANAVIGESEIEVYYENNIPYSYSKEPVVVGVYSLDDINKVLSLMRECLKNQYFGMVRSFQKNIKKLTVF